MKRILLFLIKLFGYDCKFFHVSIQKRKDLLEMYLDGRSLFSKYMKNKDENKTYEVSFNFKPNDFLAKKCELDDNSHNMPPVFGGKSLMYR
jgi:hypothetical protein